jgi:hypothetical protein
MLIRFRRTWLLMLSGLLLLAGCGGSDHVVVQEPGLVGIDDNPVVAVTAPLLTVKYVLPGVPGTTFVVSILSDQPVDGDIAYDPLLDAFTITEGPDPLQFGVDSLDPNRPEYRAFLDFPLDGSIGDPATAIPVDAIIISAELAISVNFVDFAATVPVLLDLVQYPIGALDAADYASIPLAVQRFNLFDFDAGNDVVVDVTALMVEAQVPPALADLQLRLQVAP